MSSKLISSGGYGCVYYPSINCSGNKTNKKRLQGQRYKLQTNQPIMKYIYQTLLGTYPCIINILSL